MTPASSTTLLLLRLAMAFAVAMLCACGRAPGPVTSDVYVWQRAWRPALREALARSADLAHAWRVLAAEATPQGALRPVALDVPALAATHRPVVLVVRIDGQLAELDGAALVRDVIALRARWQAAGLLAAGVEIDHDCATARLPAYAAWLGDLHRALGPGTPLSITALPAWLASPALAQVLVQADDSTLQVHAVRQPREGLFDPALALRWTTDYARLTARPFRVALPTYGSRVGFDAQGRLSDIESEAPTLRDAAERRELSVSPLAVAGFVASVQAHRPAHFEGWAWFRLPTDDDSRAWRLATWRAVVQGRPLTASAAVDWRPAESALLYDVVLVNRGDVDADAPARIALPAGCTQADGANGYRLDPTSPQHTLDAPDARLLAPHSSRMVGWVRCDRKPST